MSRGLQAGVALLRTFDADERIARHTALTPPRGICSKSAVAARCPATATGPRHVVLRVSQELRYLQAQLPG